MKTIIKINGITLILSFVTTLSLAEGNKNVFENKQIESISGMPIEQFKAIERANKDIISQKQALEKDLLSSISKLTDKPNLVQKEQKEDPIVSSPDMKIISLGLNKNTTEKEPLVSIPRPIPIFKDSDKLPPDKLPRKGDDTLQLPNDTKIDPSKLNKTKESSLNSRPRIKFFDRNMLETYKYKPNMQYEVFRPFSLTPSYTFYNPQWRQTLRAPYFFGATFTVTATITRRDQSISYIDDEKGRDDGVAYTISPPEQSNPPDFVAPLGYLPYRLNRLHEKDIRF